MALFQRIKTPLAEMGLESEISVPAGPRSAGDALRQQREMLGLNFGDVAEELRIKPAYLAALEEGRPDRLPGPAYAAGFVRAYGDHLGLDGAEILRRFRLEAAGLDAKPDLSFPMPLGERSVPSRGMLLLGVILAICGYGTWYYLSTGEHSRLERVTEVPATLLAAKQPTTPKPPALPTPLVAATSMTSSGPAGSPASALPSGSKTPATTQEKSPGAPLAPAAVAIAATPSAPPDASPSPAAASISATPPVPPDASPSPAAASTSASPWAPPGAPPSPAAATIAATQAAQPTPVPATEATADSEPRIPVTSGDAVSGSVLGAESETPHAYGASGGPARVVLRATADSWIQVRDSDQSVLFTGMLKPGESYRVPDRPGLSMRAGNAGALDVTVDDKPVPSLGPMGAVRNVALDPQLLAAKSTLHN